MSTFKFYFSTEFKFGSIDGFHLLQDHVGTNYSAPWNDYDYVVTFQIQRVFQGQIQSFGRTKVLVKGVQDTSEYFLSHGTRFNQYTTDITDLLKPDMVVSLASDIDFYQRLRKELGSGAPAFLRDLCDGSYYYSLQNDYTHWPGFHSSLFRNSMAKAMLKKGHQIARGSYAPEARFEFELNDLPDDFESIKFIFDNKRSIGSTNINLLIGRNGSGKSHVLRHVVDQLTGIRAVEQSSPYFHKVVVAAYSPFESFKTENQVFEALRSASAQGDGDVQPPSGQQSEEQSKTLQAEMERRRLLVNEYVYLGFRDPGGNFSLDWPKESSARALLKILAYDSENLWWGADSRFVLLFDTLRQSIPFDELALTGKDGSLIRFSREDEARRRSYKPLTEPVDHASGITFLRRNATSTQVQPIPLSSGQTIYSYMLPCLVAEVDDESLLILDEPELYLHPAMEVGLINMVKELLQATKSNAIIASHSSILAREVERRGIAILRRDGNTTTVSPPTFETFGQSVELIMGEAFDDYRVKKAYEGSLDKAVRAYGSPEEALAGLGSAVGDEALAYLASKLDDNDELVLVRRSEPDTDDDDAQGPA